MSTNRRHLECDGRDIYDVHLVHAVARINCRFRSREKSRAFPSRHLRCTRLLFGGFCVPRYSPGRVFTLTFVTRFGLFSWCLGMLLRDLCPLHRCRILKVNFATGATGHCHQMQRH